MKRFAIMTLLSCFVFFLSACGEQQSEPKPATDEAVAQESVEKASPAEKKALEAEPSAAQEAGASAQE